jgi:uncharacterized protein YlxW (UPF0749 family)
MNRAYRPLIVTSLPQTTSDPPVLSQLVTLTNEVHENLLPLIRSTNEEVTALAAKIASIQKTLDSIAASTSTVASVVDDHLIGQPRMIVHNPVGEPLSVVGV